MRQLPGEITEVNGGWWTPMQAVPGATGGVVHITQCLNCDTVIRFEAAEIRRHVSEGEAEWVRWITSALHCPCERAEVPCES